MRLSFKPHRISDFLLKAKPEASRGKRTSTKALMRRLDILEQIINGAGYKEIAAAHNISAQRVRALAVLAVRAIRESEDKDGMIAYEQGIFSAKELRDNKEFWLGALQKLRAEFGIV